MSRPRSLIGRVAVGGGVIALAAVGLPAAASTSGASARSAGSVVAQSAYRPLLSLGDTGPSVAAWQRQLNLLTRSEYLAVDGVYATTSESATMNFQRFFGLRVDGVVGVHTRDVMRFLLAVSRNYTPLFEYGGRRVVGYAGEASYCFEVEAGDEFSVECPSLGRGPLNGEAIAVTGLAEPQLIGTTDDSVGSVVVDTANGTVPANVVDDVRGLGRHVWSTALPPSQVSTVRALAPDGTEIRRLAITDAAAYLVLERGDRGPAVLRWQEQLNSLTNAGLALDGVFGERVVAATRNFEAFFGLHVDGIVGPETRDALTLIGSVLARSPATT